MLVTWESTNSHITSWANVFTISKCSEVLCFFGNINCPSHRIQFYVKHPLSSYLERRNNNFRMKLQNECRLPYCNAIIYSSHFWTCILRQPHIIIMQICFLLLQKFKVKAYDCALSYSNAKLTLIKYVSVTVIVWMRRLLKGQFIQN